MSKSQYYYLEQFEDDITVREVTAELGVLTKALDITDRCYCIAAPLQGGSQMIVGVDQKTCSTEDVNHLLSHLALRTGGVLYTSDSIFGKQKRLLADSYAETSTDFLERVPSSDEAIDSIALSFSFDISDKPDRREFLRWSMGEVRRLAVQMDFCDNGPAIGWGEIVVSAATILDIRHDEDCTKIFCFVDCTFSGAGMYVRMLDFAHRLAENLKCELVIDEDPRVTYPKDGDFSKLRSLFYDFMRQELAFAVCDDREGLQAYIGWMPYTFEVADIPGSVATLYGRWKLSTLISSIERFGFPVTCDRYLLPYNTPHILPDAYVSEACHYLSMEPFALFMNDPDVTFSALDKPGLLLTDDMFHYALFAHPGVHIPKAEYRAVRGHASKAGQLHTTNYIRAKDLKFDYPISYLENGVYYGFGRFLRRVRVPGWLALEELGSPQHFMLCDSTKTHSLIVECSIDYGVEEGAKTTFESRIPRSAEQRFDLGGTSWGRCGCVTSKSGMAYGEAEIYIADECYRFAVACDGDADAVNEFLNSLREARNVEDWYEVAGAELAFGSSFHMDDPDPDHFREKFPQYLDPEEGGAAYELRGFTPPKHKRLASLDMGLMQNMIPMGGMSDDDDDDDDGVHVRPMSGVGALLQATMEVFKAMIEGKKGFEKLGEKYHLPKEMIDEINDCEEESNENVIKEMLGVFKRVADGDISEEDMARLTDDEDDDDEDADTDDEDDAADEDEE